MGIEGGSDVYSIDINIWIYVPLNQIRSALRSFHMVVEIKDETSTKKNVRQTSLDKRNNFATMVISVRPTTLVTKSEFMTIVMNNKILITKSTIFIRARIQNSKLQISEFRIQNSKYQNSEFRTPNIRIQISELRITNLYQNNM